MAQGKRVLNEKVKAEMHQSVVEVGTGVCRDMDEARADIVDLRRQMLELARQNGLLLVAGATHPVRRLAGAGHLARRALPAGGRGHAAGGARRTSSSGCTCTSASKTARPSST